MTTPRPVYASTTSYESASRSNSHLPASGEGPSVTNEISPLLGHKHAPAHQPFISGSWHSALSSFLDDNAGLLLVAASSVFYSAMNVSVKLLNSLDEPVPTLELILVRMGITYICSAAYMYWQKIPDPILGPKGVRILLVFRGLSGFVGLCGMYFSLLYLSLSDATVLTFITPIFTGFSGAIFLKEPLSLRELLAGLFSFIGVLLIARPRFLFGNPQTFLNPSEVTPAQRVLSVTAALIGVVGATSALTFLRAIGKRAHVLHAMMSFASQCVLGSTLGMILFKTPLVLPTQTLWMVLLLLIGVLGFFAQVLLTMGLQRETAGRGSLAIYTSIVFAVMFEYLIFHTTPSTLSIVGALIIVSSALYITLTKQKQETVAVPASGTTAERSAGYASAVDRNSDPEA